MGGAFLGGAFLAGAVLVGAVLVVLKRTAFVGLPILSPIVFIKPIRSNRFGAAPSESSSDESWIVGCSGNVAVEVG